MEDVATAIMSLFNATESGNHNYFYNDIGGRLYNTTAPERIEYPFCVFYFVSIMHEFCFDNVGIENMVVQFSIYDANVNSTKQLRTIRQHMNTLFDACSLVVVNYTFKYMRWERDYKMMIDLDGFANVPSDYRILVEA